MEESIVENVTTCYATCDKEKNRAVLAPYIHQQFEQYVSFIREVYFSMATTETEKPTCPVCHQNDMVMTMQAAYESGVERAAPPDMPTKTISMMPYIIACAVLVGIFIFLIIVLIGGLEASLNSTWMIVLVGLTFLSIVTALVVSYNAFQRVVKGDAEATERFPAWDHATAAWNKLRYCKRDDVVFDPSVDKVVSNEAVAAIRSMQEGSADKVASTLIKN